MERKNKKYDDITSPIFQTVLNEYNAVFERSRSIDARAGILLTFMITALPFYFQIIDLKYFKQLIQINLFSFIDALQLIFFFCSITVFLIAFIFLVIVLCTRKYKVYNTNLFSGFEIITYEDLDTTINDITVGLFKDIPEIIEFNIKVVEKKAKRFSVSLWLCFSFIATMIATIIISIF